MTDLIITGITGFVGRYIVDEALNRGIYNHIYGISRRWVEQEALARKWGNRVTMINGDIRDKNALKRLFAMTQYPPDVIHAAAYKHISMAAANPEECSSVNIDGTKNLLEVSKPFGVRNIIFISTDKASHPVSTYGQSKAIAEQMVLNAGGTVLRFGNIWNSTGSLIGKWHKTMQSDSPILEITEPTMTRYFFPIREVVEYILMATDYSDCTIVPRLKSTDLMNLANAFQSAYNKKAEIKVIGIRPGEKLHEQMTCIEELSCRRVEILHNKYLKLVDGTHGKLIAGFEGMLSSGIAPRFTQNELIQLINSTKEG